jgi:hypothetical protein
MLGVIASELALVSDGVAVGRGLCHHIGAEHARLAAAIVDHDRLPCDLRHTLPDHARDDVVRAARRERYDQADRFRREIFGRRDCRQQHQHQQGQQPTENSHANLLGHTIPRRPDHDPFSCLGRIVSENPEVR